MLVVPEFRTQTPEQSVPPFFDQIRDQRRAPMEESKAAAYYEELTRKGEGAARFKQGLGFSSSSSSSSRFPPQPSSSLSTSFVRASSPGKAGELQKQIQLEKIQKKLNPSSDPRDRDGRRSGGSRRRSPSRERDRDRSSHRHRESSHRRSRRSRSRSNSPLRESRGGDPERGNKRDKKGSPHSRSSKKKSADIDYSQLIDGYSDMTPVERVKAKMKLQLSQTAAKDTAMGMSTGWERFDFNKDAPLDGDDEIEVAEDDASLVKVIGKSFRSSAAEAKHEEEVKAAHDQAMFGAPAGAGSAILTDTGSDQDTDSTDLGEKNPLISDKVFAMQQGSWRDRVRRFQNSSGS